MQGYLCKYFVDNQSHDTGIRLIAWVEACEITIGICIPRGKIIVLQ